MNGPLPELLATRASLLARLKNWGDQASWQTFFDTYWKLIYSVAIKAGLDAAAAQDVVQETVLSVAQNIGRFQYDPNRGSFKNWLLTVTRSRIADQFRKRLPLANLGAADADPSRTALLERIPDPAGSALESLWEVEWKTHIAETALRQIKRRIPQEQYEIFDLYVLENWPAARVAKALGVSIAKVYVVKHRINRLLAAERRRLINQPL